MDRGVWAFNNYDLFQRVLLSTRSILDLHQQSHHCIKLEKFQRIISNVHSLDIVKCQALMMPRPFLKSASHQQPLAGSVLPVYNTKRRLIDTPMLILGAIFRVAQINDWIPDQSDWVKDLKKSMCLRYQFVMDLFLLVDALMMGPSAPCLNPQTYSS